MPQTPHSPPLPLSLDPLRTRVQCSVITAKNTDISHLHVPTLESPLISPSYPALQPHENLGQHSNTSCCYLIITHRQSQCNQHHHIWPSADDQRLGYGNGHPKRSDRFLLGLDKRAIQANPFLSNCFSSIISTSSFSLSSSSSATILGANRQHLKIPLIFHRQSEVSVHAMIDSSASSSFIHHKFVQQNKIKTIPLLSPIPLYNIDNSGNTAGEITTMAILDIQWPTKRILCFAILDV
jgi:hypothetical protein